MGNPGHRIRVVVAGRGLLRVGEPDYHSVPSRRVCIDCEGCRVVVTWCSADAVDGRAVLGSGELHDLGVTTQFRILGLQIRPMQSVLAGADLDGVDSGFTRHRDLVYPPSRCTAVSVASPSSNTSVPLTATEPLPDACARNVASP